MEPSKQGSGPLATLSTLNEFYAQGRYSDVTIAVGGEIFPSQRSVLAAISKYFDTMFSSDFKEKDADTIAIHDIDASTFREILQLKFADQICITDSNVHSLLVASDFLQLRDSLVEDRCFQYLQERTGSDSVPLLSTFEILSFSHATKKARILHLLCAHVSKHFMHFAEDDKFMEIPFEILIAILAECRKDYDEPDDDDDDDDSLTYRYERGNARLRVVISWLGHSRTERSQYRNKLMSYIDTSELSIDYALTLMNNSENFVDQVVKHGDKVALPTNDVKLKAVLAPRSETNAFAMGTTIIIQGQDFSRMGPQFYLESERSIHGMECRVTINNSEKGWLEIGVELVTLTRGEFDNYESGGYLVKAHFSIVSQKEGKEDLTEDFQTDVSECFGLYVYSFKLADYAYLVQEENGYIKNDCVTFQLRLSFF